MLRFAYRYLISRGSHTVVNIIARVSLIAIATPVAAMVLLLSIFNGFGDIAEELSSALDASLTVQSAHGRMFEMESIDRTAIENIEEVTEVSFGLEQTLVVRRADNEAVLRVRGVEPQYMSIAPVGESILVGESNVEFGRVDRLILGNSIARKLGVKSLRGAEVTLYALRRGAVSSLLPLGSYNREKVEIGGVYLLDTTTEEEHAITSLRLMQRLLRAEGMATELHVGSSVRNDRRADVERLKREVQSTVGEDFVVRSRYEMNEMVHTIVRTEKQMITLIGVMVMMLASFTLIGAVTMLTIDKRGEEVVMRAMGASMRYIRGVFITSGVLIAAVGTVAGGVLGVLLALAQQWGKFVKMPSGGVLMDVYPVRLFWGDVVVVVISSVVISSLICVAVVRANIKGGRR